MAEIGKYVFSLCVHSIEMVHNICRSFDVFLQSMYTFERETRIDKSTNDLPY